MNFRSLVFNWTNRERFAEQAGLTFLGKRDLYKALGYKRALDVHDYRSRFRRNGVANRIVKALPKATWRGSAEVIEDEDPTITTAFEDAFDKLATRLKLWSIFQRADILAGIGRYAIIVIGAPGELDTELLTCSADDIKFLMPFSEEDAKISTYDDNSQSPRFGHPTAYSVSRTAKLTRDAAAQPILGKTVHWTRTIHVADGLLDDNVFGEPRLECVWNFLDDLEKVSGGGSEAFWRRADQGTQFDLDPAIDFEDEDATGAETPAKTSMKQQVEDYEHGMRRFLLTRGVKIKSLGSDVADFKSPVDAIISLISASTGIPQRVLMGSEQGKLAAQMDRSNWDDRVVDRRDDYAAPYVVNAWVDRVISLGAVPVPKEYHCRWSAIKVMDEEQRANIATKWAGLNQAAGEIVVTADEIRDRILGLSQLSDVTQETFPNSPLAARKWNVLTTAERRQVALRLNKRKERPTWEGIHRAADRFRPKIQKLCNGAFSQGRRSFTLGNALDHALALKDVHGLLTLGSEAITATADALREALPDLLGEVMAAAGKAQEKVLRRQVRGLRAAEEVTADVPFAFNATNARAIAWAKQHAAELIEDISETTREEIRAVVEAAFESQFDVEELANRLTVIVGDAARAELIARTESMAAANAGQQELWAQATDAGLLTGQEQQLWIVTPDDTLCAVCRGMDGQLSPLGEPFDVEGEAVYAPPAHPNCRCAIGLSLET